MYRRKRPKPSQRKKQLSEETLQIAEERIEVKSKGDGDRYSQLNAVFQRIEVEIKNILKQAIQRNNERDEMEKTRDPFKKE